MSLKKEKATDIILEAKAIRKQIEQQLKETVQESFAPSIKAMVDAKLQETSDHYGQEEDETEMDEAFDINSLMQEASEDEDGAELGDEMEDEFGTSDEGDSGLGEKIGDMTLTDLVSALVPALKSSLGLGDEVDTQDQSEMPEMGDEQSGEEAEDEKVDEDLFEIESLIGMLGESDDKDEDDMAKLKKENEDLREAFKILKQTLNESTLGTAHAKFVNKLVLEGNLSREETIKLSEAFDKMKSVQEMERSYNLLKESFTKKAKPIKQINNNKQNIKESIFTEASLVNSNPAPVQKSKLNESMVNDSFYAHIQKNLQSK